MKYNRRETVYIVYAILMISILMASLTIIPSAQAYGLTNDKINIGYMKEVKVDGDKIIVDGKEINVGMYEGIPEEPTNGKMFLVTLDRVDMDGPNRVYEVHLTSAPEEFPNDVVTVIENPLGSIVEVRGTLGNGIGRAYSVYASTVSITLSIKWSPASQVLGIALVDHSTGDAYGYWYTGGSAQVTFILDSSNRYSIVVLPHTSGPLISYEGSLVIHSW